MVLPAAQQQLFVPGSWEPVQTGRGVGVGVGDLLGFGAELPFTTTVVLTSAEVVVAVMTGIAGRASSLVSPLLVRFSVNSSLVVDCS